MNISSEMGLLRWQILDPDFCPRELAEQELEAIKNADHRMWVLYHVRMLDNDEWRLRDYSTKQLQSEPLAEISCFLPKKDSPEAMTRIDLILHPVPITENQHWWPDDYRYETRSGIQMGDRVPDVDEQFRRTLLPGWKPEDWLFTPWHWWP